MLFSHSELLHLCVYPSREPDALRVPHPPRLMDPCSKYAPTKTALQAKAAAAPASGVCFSWSGAALASQVNCSAARDKGRPAKGVPNEKMKSLTRTILTKINRKQTFHPESSEIRQVPSD